MAHSEHTHDHGHGHTHGELAKPNTKVIWRTFWILLAITAAEFIVALGFEMNSTLKAAIFIGMTLVKAFYIVAEFMHLRHEVKVLIWAIVLPTIFIFWLVIALIVEGGAILEVR
jgi:cytochrome c oxidase subunit IV